MNRITRLESLRENRTTRYSRGSILLSAILIAVIAFAWLPGLKMAAYASDDTSDAAGSDTTAAVVAGDTTAAVAVSDTTAAAATEDPYAVDGSSKGVGQQVLDLPSLDEVQCASYYCYDRTTGQVLLAKEEEKRIYPASMTKILTLALAMEYLDPFETITVSKSAIDATTPNSTMMGLVVGEEIEVNELYFGLMLPSGNDAANVLAEEIAKHYADTKGALPTTTPVPTQPGDTTPAATEDPNTFSKIGQFAYIANMKIQALGLTQSHFVNPNGLQNEKHYTTAKDLTMMFDYALNFEDFCRVISTPTHFFKADNKHNFDGWKVVKNTNNLLTDPWIIGEDSHCAKVYGGKTGTTQVAGTGMTLLTINENGHEIITCVCGIPYDLADHQTIYVAAVVREANLKCWESDPVSRVSGNVVDNRGYNAPDGQGPTGERANVTVSGQDNPEDTQVTEPSETTGIAPSETTATPEAQQEEKKSLFEEHPVVFIVLIVLMVIVAAVLIITIITIHQNRKRRRRMGIRKINL
ncbi:MAG: D-alanyl-D-alanine carboxypeptidase [Clostridiales bacterium]|nr:D-alanyl-D-alanine carboxypeptidase [Clostridiales bacterium]